MKRANTFVVVLRGDAFINSIDCCCYSTVPRLGSSGDSGERAECKLQRGRSDDDGVCSLRFAPEKLGVKLTATWSQIIGNIFIETMSRGARSKREMREAIYTSVATTASSGFSLFETLIQATDATWQEQHTTIPTYCLA